MRLVPQSLAGRLVAVLLIALVAAHAVGFALFAGERRTALAAAQREAVIARTAATLRLLEAAPARLEPAVLGSVSSPDTRFRLASQSPIESDAMGRRAARLADRLARDLPGVAEARLDIRPPPRLFARPSAPDRDPDRGPYRAPGGDPAGDRFDHDHPAPAPLLLRLALRLDDGRWLVVETGRPPPPAWALAPLAALALSALAIAAVTVLVVRRLTRPLGRLAAAAEAFGRGERRDPLDESAGPAEIRRTTRAFNEMQDRLARFVADRTRMMAAIGHDLRTPITSLRLRAELVDDPETRERMLATLEQMSRMVEETLAFARADAAAEATRPIDLRALAESLAEDRRAAGEDVALEDGPPVVLPGRPTALGRALDNLIGNAVRYGERARLSLEATAESVRLHVDDDGPGIPPWDRERAFEPFVRLEASRSRETGGTGLGLAVARTLIRAHGGDVMLSEAPGGGLRATVTLPRPAAKA